VCMSRLTMAVVNRG